MALTYEEFLARAKSFQTRYIEEENGRMMRAAGLWRTYEDGMGVLKLYPLNGAEIRERQDQLRRMAADIEKTHGDNPTTRALYEMQKDG